MPYVFRFSIATVILFFVQNTFNNKIAGLNSQPLIKKVLLTVVIISAILVVFLFHYIKKWFISKYGETCYQVSMIILEVLIPICIMHLRVYPDHFNIWQIGSPMIGCLVGISIFFYYRHRKRLIDAKVIPVITKKTYFVISVAKVIPFFF